MGTVKKNLLITSFRPAAYEKEETTDYTDYADFFLINIKIPL